MRKLATIVKIAEVITHPNANALDLVRIKGWQCVSKRGEFKVGDWAVYVEIDGVLPEKPEFEFLRKVKFRIRTVRLRGEISQGIALPISILPTSQITTKLDGSVDWNYVLQEDEDVTELLGITKYEAPVPVYMSGERRGNFPDQIPKTDETRIQNLQGLLTEYADTLCYETEKLEGASITCYLIDGQFGVCSRNMDLKESEHNIYWKTAKALDVETKLRAFASEQSILNIAIQGELIGEGIEQNIYKLTGHDIRFYNIYSIDEGFYFDFEEFVSAFDRMGLKTVPIISKNHVMLATIQDYVNAVDGIKSIVNPDVLAEGRVYRPLKEMRHPRFGRISFKAISNTYLANQK